MANRYTKTPDPGKVILENLYHQEFKSQKEIGDLYNVSQKVVWRWFKDLEINSRIPYKRFQEREQNANWKGDDATYAAFHYRVEAKRGKPHFCSPCGSMDINKVYEWCNLTGNYQDVNDYERMCRSCHRKYDKNRINSSKNVRKHKK